MNLVELKEQAINGDIHAMNELARCYSMGIETEVDYNIAFAYLNQASKLGDPLAMSNLAIFYSLGICVEKDARQALQLFYSAACKGARITEYVFQYIGKKELKELAAQGYAVAEYYYALTLGNHARSKRDALVCSASKKQIALATGALALKAFLSNPSPDNYEAKALFLQAVDEGYDSFHMLCNVSETLHQMGISDAVALDIIRDYLASRHKRPFILVKVTGKKWAEKLINNGEIFARSLGGFREITKAGVGDAFEGVANTKNAIPLWKEIEEESLSEMEEYGVYDEYMAHERIFCLYALEFSENGEIVLPDIRMNQFGDTAVVIWDGIEFIKRINNAIAEKYGLSVWFGYQRVVYDVVFSKDKKYSEFSKTEPFSWQNEFRLVIDLANGRIEKKVWENMTDFAKLMYINAGGSHELFEDSGSDLITIGDISDICSLYPIEDFLRLSNTIKERAVPYRIEGSNKALHKKAFAYRPFIKL